MIKLILKNTICKIGLHIYKPFKRSGEVNWLWMTIQGKRCMNCNKEILNIANKPKRSEVNQC